MALSLEDFQQLLAQQFNHNRYQSLFYTLPDGRTLFGPSAETVRFFRDELRAIAHFLTDSPTEQLESLLRDAAERAIQTFLAANQFLDFDQEDRNLLRAIYAASLQELGKLAKAGQEAEFDELFRRHYHRLRLFLVHSNGAEIFRKYQESPTIPSIVCAEYSPEFQLERLGLRLNEIQAPVLDLGCGREAKLVHFLRAQGIEAQGIDRNVEETPFLHRGGWFDCELAPESWGTILSHMAFSNHFRHHHLRADGYAEQYARRYLDIIRSLQVGGRFVYTPDLPFFEKVLAEKRDWLIERPQNDASQVRRLH